MVNRVRVLCSFPLIPCGGLPHKDPDHRQGIRLPVCHCGRDVVIGWLVVHQVKLSVKARNVVTDWGLPIICNNSFSYNLSPSTVCSDPWPDWLPQCRWNWLRMYLSVRGPPDILAAYDSSTANWTARILDQLCHHLISVLICKLLHLRVWPLFSRIPFWTTL